MSPANQQISAIRQGSRGDRADQQVTGDPAKISSHEGQDEDAENVEAASSGSASNSRCVLTSAGTWRLRRACASRGQDTKVHFTPRSRERMGNSCGED
jgi:hypothetical protein